MADIGGYYAQYDGMARMHAWSSRVVGAVECTQHPGKDHRDERPEKGLIGVRILEQRSAATSPYRVTITLTFTLAPVLGLTSYS